MRPNPIKVFMKRFPAMTRAAAICLALTVSVWIGVKVYFHAPGPQIFLLGDSGIGNYRLDPGNRLQDVLEKANPGFTVQNWAQPGSSTGDCFLQLERGIFLAGKPSAVVIALSPDKFLDDTVSHRFTDDGENLRWIPWNSQGLAFFRSLTSQQKNSALVQQFSLPFYAASDLAKAAWIRYVQWPWERSEMRHAGHERRTKIVSHTWGMGKQFEAQLIGNDSVFASTIEAKDGEFLIHSLKKQGIQTIMVMLPFANPDLLGKTWSPSALAKRDLVVQRMRKWVEDRQLLYVDFNTTEEMEHFPDAAWDDNAHIKDPNAIAYMSHRIGQVLDGRDSRIPVGGATLGTSHMSSSHTVRAGLR